VIEAAERILLNVGSGPPGGGQAPAMFAPWRQVRVDVDPAAQPDIVADVTNLAPVGAGTVDAVWTAHCIEHLYEHDVAAALGEIGRVLKDDGFACIVVPDLQRIAALIAEDRMHETLYIAPAGPITPHDIVFGFGPAIARGQLAMAHRCGFTPSAMMRHVSAAGFGGYAVLRRANYELAAVVRKRDWDHVAQRDQLLAALGL
jgi:SAM-dependent methyltransferase